MEKSLLMESKITFVDGDDWAGLYVDGKLVLESHSLNPESVLEALGIKTTSIQAHLDWLGDMGSLPYDLKDVVAEGDVYDAEEENDDEVIRRITNQIHLSCQEGTSDKTYDISIVERDQQPVKRDYEVLASYGRRGGTMKQISTIFSTHDEASKAYDKLVSSKKKKGYIVS